MKSKNILTNLIDPDNIILKLPTPNLTAKIDISNRMIMLSGNFRMPQEISKIAYIGISKDTEQKFSLDNIRINFIITDEKNKVGFSSKYIPNNIISSTCFLSS